jgi:NAD(P)-dependent dehydrogenase (short-subunit alcohol dehydrogenase family)
MAWYESFRDKAVVVTGASSGIGRATAVAFGAAGSRVALIARRRELLDEVAGEVRSAGGAPFAHAADVTDRDAVGRAFAAVRQHFGRVDLVVNNAGVLIPSRVEDLADAPFEAMFRVNVLGALHVMQAALPIQRAQGDGCIVNVGSLAGRRGISPFGGYCATKFALVGLTEALRTELRGGPVHVALVLPGVVETPMVDQLAHDQEFTELWPSWLNMPPSWVVWAVFAAARFRLVEVSVPPGAVTLEKLGALAPGATDALVDWAKGAMRWLATLGPGVRA